MAFWAVEVKGGEICEVNLGGRLLRLKQVSLGEISGEAQQSVVFNITGENTEELMDTLEPRTQTQKSFPWLFDGPIKISHNLSNGSLYFIGTTFKPYSKTPIEDSHDDDEDEGETSTPTIHSLPPTVRECMLIVAFLEGFKEGSPRFMQVLHAFAKKPMAREFFMS